MLSTTSIVSAQISGGFEDYGGDVATDWGDDPFVLSYVVNDRDYLDIISFTYTVDQTTNSMISIFEFSDEPRHDGIYYSASFRGSTGNVDGPDFDINALDSIADIIFEYEMGEIADVRFYDADTGEEEIVFTNTTVTISENEVIIEFTYPQEFLIEEVFNQENLEIIASVNEVEGEDVYYDIIYLDEDFSLRIVTFIMIYWQFLLLGFVIIVIVGFVLVRRRISGAYTTSELE